MLRIVIQEQILVLCIRWRKRKGYPTTYGAYVYYYAASMLSHYRQHVLYYSYGPKKFSLKLSLYFIYRKIFYCPGRSITCIVNYNVYSFLFYCYCINRIFNRFIICYVKLAKPQVVNYLFEQYPLFWMICQGFS